VVDAFVVKVILIIASLGGVTLLAGFILRATYKAGKLSGKQEIEAKEAAANETINKRALDALSRGAHARRVGVRLDDPNNRTKRTGGTE